MADHPIARADITGLVLAGGQGSRMGGIDKGLQRHHGQPLALNAARRLAPQVGSLAFSANRHLDEYARFGWMAWPDPPDLPGYQGPLAGVLSGLQRCETSFLVTVPCDCPHFPEDLVRRLGAALGGADLAMARTPAGREPAFCLMRGSVRASLVEYLSTGQRQIERWTSQLQRVDVNFDDPQAFFNINTPDDLAQA